MSFVDAPPPALQDASLRKLRARVNEQLAHRMEQLAAGSASRNHDEITPTAEKYAAQVAYIQALKAMLELCNEIDRELYGDTPLADR